MRKGRERERECVVYRVGERECVSEREKERERKEREGECVYE